MRPAIRSAARQAKRLAVALLLGAVLVPVAAAAPHTIQAKGAHGWIKFWASGSGSVRVSLKGSLTIENASGLQIKVDGTWGEMKKHPDGVTYTHFEGSVECIGIGAHMEIRGWNLELSAKGNGKAHFQGEGTARVDDGPEQPWPGDMTHQKWLKLHYGN